MHYSDPDFAAVRVLGIELMLHADHTYEANPWSARLKEGTLRGLGAELRLLGMDPDEVAQLIAEETESPGSRPVALRASLFEDLGQ